MKRSAIAFTLVALLCSTSYAQEQETREREGQRGGERARREYGRGRLAVEDPAGFKTEGKQIFSGPQPGEKLPAFKATSLAGDSKGKELDPIALADDNPQILFFQDEGGVGIRGLYGVVDAISKIDRKTDEDLHIACVFLSDDTEKVNPFAGVFSALLLRGVDVITVSKDGRDGPGAYGLNRTVSQTIILAKDGKVTRNFVFPQGMLYADPHVMGGIAELIGEERETVAAWLNEAVGNERMRAGGDLARRQTVFGERIRALVEAGKLTREEAGELYRIAFPENGRGETRPQRERENRERERGETRP